MTKRLEPIPVQAALINDIPEHSFSPSMRVNCATLARLFNVSRTSISRYVADGKIQLDVNGLACPKAAAQSVLESATAGRTKAKFFKTQVDQTNALQNENDVLKKKLLDVQTKLIELESALTETTATLTEWQDDYIQLESTIENFIEQLITETDLQQAVQQGNGAILQNAFDNLLELKNESN